MASLVGGLFGGLSNGISIGASMQCTAPMLDVTLEPRLVLDICGLLYAIVAQANAFKAYQLN